MTTPNERCPRCGGPLRRGETHFDLHYNTYHCQAPTSEQSEAMKGGDETCAQTSTTMQDAPASCVRASNAAATSDPLLAATWQPIETAPKDGTRVLAYCPAFGQRETYADGTLKPSTVPNLCQKQNENPNAPAKTSESSNEELSVKALDTDTESQTQLAKSIIPERTESTDPLLAATRITELENAIRRIRALTPEPMGDYWANRDGLNPDTVFDICDEVLPPTP